MTTQVSQHSPPRLVFSVREVAAMLGVSTRTVRDLMRSGDLPSVRIGGRNRVPRGALERLASGPIDKEKANG